MTATAEVTVDLRNMERILKELKQAKRLVCNVGVDSTKAYGSGTPVSEVATYLEYGWKQTATWKQRNFILAVSGIDIKRGTLVCPARPTFRTTQEAHKEEWLKVGESKLKHFVQSPLNAMTEALKTMGMMAQQDLRACINTNGASNGTPFAPRSPLTMAMYSAKITGEKHKTDETSTAGRKQALRNEGTFANSIAFEIVKQ